MHLSRIQLPQELPEARRGETNRREGMAKKHELLYCDWRTWLASFGVFEIGTDMVPSFNSEKGVQATQFYKDLMDKYKVVPQAAKTWTWDEVTTAFGSGLTAIAMNYHRMLLDPAIEQKGGQAAFAMVPGERQADGSVLRGPPLWHVLPGSQQIRESTGARL